MRISVGIRRQAQIVDYDGKDHALHVRKIEGEPIIGEAHGIPGVGDLSWDAGVVVNRQADIDFLKIGGLGTYISWQEFVRLVRRNRRYAGLLAQCDAFGDPHLSGLVEAPRLNDYRGTNSNSLEGDIADDESLVEGILITLIEQMLPGVRKALKADDRRVTTDDSTFLSTLARGIQESTGVKPTGANRKVRVVQRHAHIVLEPNESQEIEVRVEPGVMVVWDDSKSGCTVSPKRGAKTVVTAGQKSGKDFVLVARNMADATQLLYEVRIEIVPQIPFAFTKPVYRMDVGDRVHVAIDERAVRHTSGDIMICLAMEQPEGTPGDVRIEHKSGAADAYVLSDEHTGYVDIVAYDAKAPNTFRARTKVSVEKGVRDRAKSQSPLDINFVVNDHLYELAVMIYSGSAEAARHVSYLSRGETRSTITLNRSSKLFDGKPETVQFEHARWQIAMRIAENENDAENASLDLLTQEAGVVYSFITKSP